MLGERYASDWVPGHLNTCWERGTQVIGKGSRKSITDQDFDERAQILMIERDIMVPVKWALAGISLFFVWLINRDALMVTGQWDVHDWTFYIVLSFYVATNIAFSYLFWKRKQDPLRWVRWHAWSSLTADALFVGGLIYFTGGEDSELYLIYCMLFMRNAAHVPDMRVQAPTHLGFVACYVLGVFLHDPSGSFGFLRGHDFIIRVTLLLGVALCSGAMSRLIKSRQEDLSSALGRLRRTQDRLVRSERLAVLGQAAAGVAHELKNPLASITNAVYYLNKRIGGDADAEVRKNMDIVREEVRRSDRIIMDMLDHSSQVDRSRAVIQVNDIVREILADVRPDARSRGIRVHAEFGIRLPLIRADEHQIKMAVRNLVDNACQAMSEGGSLSVVTGLRQGRSVLGAREAIVVTVEDTGEGIPEELRDRIFEPFFSLKKDGTGLGLFAASNAVQAYGGHIEVESEPGRGAAFSAVLPVESVVQPTADRKRRDTDG